jgi:AcrR family transcriptional regulator
VARPRDFDERIVRAQSRELFSKQGYHATSIDDLVQKTGLLRGSLYKAFGSKRNLFESVLTEVAQSFEASRENLDLLTVALKELAPDDLGIRRICQAIVRDNDADFAELLGRNLLLNMKEINVGDTDN